MTTENIGAVGGRFRIRGLLGSGGTASVYEAFDTDAGGLVALKILHSHLVSVPGARAAFLREADLARQVAHPSIPRVIAVGADPTEAVWTAWAFAPGVTLAEMVRAEGPLPLAQAARVAELVLDALGAVHRAGLAHRDVSASNVLIRRDAAGSISGVSVIDFGLADEIGRTTRANDVLLSSGGESEGTTESTVGDSPVPQVVGNPAYASPEQLRGEPVGVAGDLYQVGGLLHMAIVGEPPFVRPRIEDTIRAHLAAVPPTVSIRVRGVPIELDRVIVRSLLKDPDERFASADEMRAALVRAVGTPPRSRVARDPSTETSTDTPLQATRVLAAVVPLSTTRPARPAASPVLWALLTGATVLVATVVFALVPRGGPVEVQDAETTPTATAAPSAPAPTPPVLATTVPVADVPSARTRVPEVVGRSLEEARAILTGAGLDASAAPTVSDGPQAPGTVVATTPAPGDTVAPGSAVALTVASGFTVVPDVRSRGADEAQYTVASAGLDVALRRVATTAAPPGTVIDTEPATATRVERGTRIVLLIAGEAPAAGPASTSPSATPTRSPTPSASP